MYIADHYTLSYIDYTQRVSSGLLYTLPTPLKIDNLEFLAINFWGEFKIILWLLPNDSSDVSHILYLTTTTYYITAHPEYYSSNWGSSKQRIRAHKLLVALIKYN